MKRTLLCLACWFLPLVPFASVAGGDPYESLKQLPGDDSSGAQEGSPYESFSNLPKASDERHPTLQNEYSAPDGQGQ
jgi:hypothetical protein